MGQEAITVSSHEEPVICNKNDWTTVKEAVQDLAIGVVTTFMQNIVFIGLTTATGSRVAAGVGAVAVGGFLMARDRENLGVYTGASVGTCITQIIQATVYPTEQKIATPIFFLLSAAISYVPVVTGGLLHRQYTTLHRQT